MDLIELLAAMVVHQASDLFISVDSPPLIKVEGDIRPVREERLDEETNHKLIYSILNEEDIATFRREKELNKSLKIDRLGRFRLNVFQQQGEPAMVVRYIKKIIPSIKELGLPPSLQDLMDLERGLVLLVGATGTGKSTTLASMIDYRNSTRSGHILTIEDPIEFTHKNKKSLVNQREVGVDTESFSVALKNAMREAPDVILIGEIRDRETMKMALTYAETGHLCLATLHANNANQALERIFNFFPEEAKNQILQDLAMNLRAIIAQRLCVGLDNRRVPAVEMMHVTPYIKELIERGKLDEIKEAMERAQGRPNQTFDQALIQLVKDGKISEQEALRKADSRNNIALAFKLSNAEDEETKMNQEGEYVLDRKAPFAHYRTFSIRPLTVRSKSKNTKQKINTAIMLALKDKGLRLVNDNADLEVQYILGVKKEDELELEPIEGRQARVEFTKNGNKELIVLMINIIDTSSGKPIYRISASKKSSVFEESQGNLNMGIASLLKPLPVGNG